MRYNIIIAISIIRFWFKYSNLLFCILRSYKSSYELLCFPTKHRATDDLDPPRVFRSQHFLSWLISALSTNEKVKVVNDQISNPVYIPDLVDVITTSILLDYTGVCHYGSEDVVSRYDFAIKACRIFGYNSSKILPIHSDELKQAALRPKKSSLNCQKIAKDLNIELYTTDYSLNRIHSNK